MDTTTLIWLFPIAFILHDFEELMLFEPWLKKNSGAIMERLQNKIPAFVENRLRIVLTKSTTQFAFPIFLIFVLTVLSSLLAAEFGRYSLFLIAGSLFFLHGFMHIGQAVLLRRYVPALITSVLIALPYGAILFSRLLQEEIVSSFILCIYFLVSIVLAIPFILGMHKVGELVYDKVMRLINR